ncbi:CMGC/DYRK/DYRK2 protein kinase [Pleurostoma richardsiae]|uniref:dual-specificity kinase n=1 Tax=Pleurostoma richardsiae TaxID=41990 RepID=A0AA38RQV9_9PEZI|nr:CMGC/DYRK/DYRK2 protein kinase [Pleurostoma richardsiae]
MIREHKVPAGPRPANQSPTRRRASASPTKSIFPKGSAVNGPMLSASSSNNHSLFSFGRNGAADDGADTSASFDFLPSVSFDDLQSSLESASTEFKLTQFPSPTGHGSILESEGMVEKKNMAEQSNVTRTGGTTRVAIQPGPARSRTGSILRRPSVSNRQSSISSTASATSGPPADAPSAPAAMRPRRQSQYPPVSNSNIGKPPRKSVGPGIFEPDYGTRASQRRRPSLAAGSDRTGYDSARSSVDGSGRFGDTSRNLTVSRASKTKSIQPPPRVMQPSSSTGGNSLAPEQNSVSTTFPRSPRASKGGASTPSSGKRMSIMPGVHNASHATGLGARTISPTDTRRMKRMSTMPHSQSTSQVMNPPPPPPPAADVRSSSRSPSMLPRKTSTPSSSRTTPDPNRKSYSSGLSIGSTTSYNTVRTSTGSIQPRLPQGGSSRLPAPKALNLQNTSTLDDDEDVPPVPAIPKVYESPKDSPAELSFLEKRKSNFAFDTSSIHSNSTGSLSNLPVQEPVKAQRKPSTRKTAGQNATLQLDKKGSVMQQRKNLKALDLPPITLAPISTPTVAKIAALQEQASSDRSVSPTPTRHVSKTPTTPLTASKSTFFSRHRANEKPEMHHMRSTSSIHQSRPDSPLVPEASSSSESVPSVSTKVPASKRPNISPFLSSSVPKSQLMEPAYLKRSKTSGEFPASSDNTTESIVHQKPSGPRAPRAQKSAPKSPIPLSSPEEPPTPSSMSSLRRKLSLSWKRSNSKSSLGQVPAASDKSSDHGHHAKQDSMPPPRIPISSTVNTMTSIKPPSPSSSSVKSNGMYLESRRRKSSASSLNAIMAQERNRNDGPHSIERSAKVDSTSSTDRSTNAHNSSVMQKFLKSKASTNAIRPMDVWTSDLDKDDLIAEEEMRKLGSRRKETELAAKTLDALRKRATPKERVSPQDAIRIAMLNIYERGEIVDYSDIYFCGTQNAAKVVGDLNSDAPNFGYDDERGDYTIIPGDHLAYRYEIIDVLGKGSFGQVVRCIDHKTGVLVAVKIIRNKKRFHQQALVEVNILQKLREWDPKNKHSMVSFTHSFYFRGHLCISTELLDMNLYEFIKSNAFRGFSLKMIRRFTKQMLSSLNLLKQHKVIHCDLKPENILLRHPLHTEIKVIDFGSSCFETEKVYTYIQSRFYRSPEVILGMTYGMPIDMWSLGCILAELYTGVPIFPGENEQEQLACIMEVFGPPEKHLIEKSTRKKLFFDSMGKPRLTVSSKGRRRRPSSKTLQQVLKCDDDAFLDFIARCLRWDPDRRMKPDEAIRHEFITGQKTSVPVPRAALRDSSPIKRHNTISTPRPLPEPPGAAFKGGASLRPRDATGVTGISPIKPGAGSRRASGFAATTSAATAKRTSTGTGGISAGTSNLPRAAGRSVSKDLAAAGATVAMNRRA